MQAKKYNYYFLNIAGLKQLFAAVNAMYCSTRKHKENEFPEFIAEINREMGKL